MKKYIIDGIEVIELVEDSCGLLVNGAYLESASIYEDEEGNPRISQHFPMPISVTSATTPAYAVMMCEDHPQGYHLMPVRAWCLLSWGPTIPMVYNPERKDLEQADWHENFAGVVFSIENEEIQECIDRWLESHEEPELHLASDDKPN